MKIAILGYGNFGSGFGAYLSSIGHEIIKEEIVGADVILVSVPSFAVVPVLLNLKKDLDNRKIIICSKGFTSNGNLISNELKENGIENIFFLYGPTIVDEIMNGEISGMVLSGGIGKEDLQKQIQSEKLHIELSDDIVGVEVGSALKNVMTIFIGIAEGSGCSKNTCAFLLVKCLEEIQKFGIALGAEKSTFYGLSCLGDLTLDSRNRHFGIEFGKGRKSEEIIKEIGFTLEGTGTLKNTVIKARELGIDIPIVNIIYSILFENSPILDGIKKIK